MVRYIGRKTKPSKHICGTCGSWLLITSPADSWTLFPAYDIKGLSNQRRMLFEKIIKKKTKANRYNLFLYTWRPHVQADTQTQGNWLPGTTFHAFDINRFSRVDLRTLFAFPRRPLRHFELGESRFGYNQFGLFLELFELITLKPQHWPDTMQRRDILGYRLSNGSGRDTYCVVSCVQTLDRSFWSGPKNVTCLLGKPRWRRGSRA